MSPEWSAEYFGKIEKYPLKILLLGPADDSPDEPMREKRKVIQEAIGTLFPEVQIAFFTPGNVRDPDDWLPEVRSFGIDEADYVFCLLTSTVSLFAEGTCILSRCRGKQAVFYDSSAYQSDGDLRTIVNQLRREKVPLQNVPAERINECHVCSRVVGIMYRLLETRDWA